ncbi:helix-turn-helix domain-containing protein [Desulfothermobacter acidiphilus]|uniref:helix-turn-helix domain-containing protein n=1 Tax=Desulfothermobacter acidiphilus TaxID=1938353 RepID=UPI003F88DFA5
MAMINGERIRALREEKGMSLHDLARRAQISLSYLSEIERGTKRPSLKTIEKLAQALNVSKARLVDTEMREGKINVGEQIRLLRTEKGWSLQELSCRAGISASYLSEIERGTVYPSLSTLKRLAEELGVAPVTFLGHQGTLGTRLRSLREEYGLTQAQLAAMAGVTAGLIGQIEQGKVQPSLKTLEKIAQAMGVSPCYFLIEPEASEQVFNVLNPDLRELLADTNVQAVLTMLANMSKKEIRFVLNFIQLFKQSGFCI